MTKKLDKFEQSILTLSHVLQFQNEIDKEEVYYLGISKAYEVALEYSWKHLKKEIDSAGLEAFSPREVMKVAARMNLIDDLELWLSFLDARNLAVHDYIGFDRKSYIAKIREFLPCAQRLLKAR